MGSSERTRQKAYNVWSMMKQRCNNPKAANYANYGAKGVRVCARWLSSYDAFVADMGQPPRGATLDRADPNGNYEPGNCRWVDISMQNNNKRNNIHLSHADETLTVAQWSRKRGWRPDIIHHRISAGWSVPDALDTPLEEHTKKVRQLSLGGEFISEFSSFADAGNALGVDKRGIWNAASGKCKTAHGFRWEYA